MSMYIYSYVNVYILPRICFACCDFMNSERCNVCVCLCVFVFVSVCFCVFVCVFVCTYGSLSLSLSLSLFLSFRAHRIRSIRKCPHCRFLNFRRKETPQFLCSRHLHFFQNKLVKTPPPPSPVFSLLLRPFSWCLFWPLHPPPFLSAIQYVCMYVCALVLGCIHMHVQVSMYTYGHTRAFVCIHVHVCVHLHMYVHVCACTWCVCMCVHMYLRTQQCVLSA